MDAEDTPKYHNLQGGSKILIEHPGSNFLSRYPSHMIASIEY